MELRQIRYFCAVAEELSFVQASRRLFVAQPALSVQIRALEDELGTRLLQRTTRTVTLTAAGAIFLKEARDILQRVDVAKRSAREAEAGIIGTLRLGYVPAFATARLGIVLRRFRKQFPQIKLTLLGEETWTQFEMLHADKIDLALVRPPLTSSGLAGTVIAKHRMIVALPTGSDLAKKKNLTWSDFHEQPMIRSSLPEDFYYEPFLACCARENAFPIIADYADNLMTKFWLVSSGAGFSPTTDTAAEFHRSGLLFRSLPNNAPMVETMAVWRDNEKRAHVIQLIAALKGYPHG